MDKSGPGGVSKITVQNVRLTTQMLCVCSFQTSSSLLFFFLSSQFNSIILHSPNFLIHSNINININM
ncbi:hypothetical protein RIF29_13049 [Crotalaria pallida]|uniref:Uncharacterized protein n=1 Tax=Crotalaria pallida TaxID=3830 RepID=A0AAN9INT8_CROPI